MSFDLYVFDAEPDLDRVRALLDEDEGEHLTPALTALCRELEAAFPLTDDDLEGTPWATWPLDQPVAGGRGCAVNLVWSQVEPGVAAVVRAAQRHGLVVYDPQTDTLLDAGAAPDLPPDGWWENPPSSPTAPPKRRWWRRGG